MHENDLSPLEVTYLSDDSVPIMVFSEEKQIIYFAWPKYSHCYLKIWFAHADCQQQQVSFKFATGNR